jgi:hypothetical protein
MYQPVLQDSRLHEVRWQADTFLDVINTMCQLGDNSKLESQNFYVLWERNTMRSPLKVFMDRIEKLEMVNSVAVDWRTLVDGVSIKMICVWNTTSS